MSHVTCHDHLVGPQMFDGSYVHFLGSCLGFAFMIHDMI